MPQLKTKQPLKKIVLPESSTPGDEAYVMLDNDPRGGDILQVVSKSDIKQISEFEAGMRMLVVLIKEWNFTDDSGQPLPITLENIMLLPSGDITLIIQELQSLQGLSDTKKKN